MSKVNVDLNKLRNGKWNLSVNVPEEILIPILKEIDKQLNLCGVMQSLLCVDSKTHNFLTVGKKYKILQKNEFSCIIVNDLGIQQVYSMDCFESENK